MIIHSYSMNGIVNIISAAFRSKRAKKYTIIASSVAFLIVSISFVLYRLSASNTIWYLKYCNGGNEFNKGDYKMATLYYNQSLEQAKKFGHNDVRYAKSIVKCIKMNYYDTELEANRIFSGNLLGYKNNIVGYGSGAIYCSNALSKVKSLLQNVKVNYIHEQCINDLRSAIQIIEKNKGSNSIELIEPVCWLAIYCQYTNNLVEAKKLFSRAWDISRSYPGNGYEEVLAEFIGNYYTKTNNPKALYYLNYSYSKALYKNTLYKVRIDKITNYIVSEYIRTGDLMLAEDFIIQTKNEILTNYSIESNQNLQMQYITLCENQRKFYYEQGRNEDSCRAIIDLLLFVENYFNNYESKSILNTVYLNILFRCDVNQNLINDYFLKAINLRYKKYGAKSVALQKMFIKVRQYFLKVGNNERLSYYEKYEQSIIR